MTRVGGLLSGVRVLDLTHILAGPFCTMILGDLGAEVIKVERVQQGDLVRTIPPFIGDQSHYFLAINRNKKSFACDLHDPRARELVAELAASCDIVIDNFRPGVTQRLGLDHDSLAQRDPDVISCSITGFGSTGEWSSRPSFDLVNQALTGVMSITGEPGGPPLKTGIPIGDLAGGLWAAIAILAALQRRSSSGRGSRLEISMMDGLYGLLGYLGQLALLTGENPARVGNGHHSIVPYGRYETSDGEIVLALHVGSFWHNFALAAGLGDLLEDPRFVTSADRLANRDALERIVQETVRQHTTGYWTEALATADVPYAPILGVYDALMSDYATASDLLAPMTHPTAGDLGVVASPVRVDGERSLGPDGHVAPAPLLGADTASVLRDILALSEERIAELASEGVIARSETVPTER